MSNTEQEKNKSVEEFIDIETEKPESKMTYEEIVAKRLLEAKETKPPKPTVEPVNTHYILQNIQTKQIFEYHEDIGFANNPIYQKLLAPNHKTTEEQQKIIDEWRANKNLESAKLQKKDELEKAYDNAQWVKVENGISFDVKLRGELFVLLRQKVVDAENSGKASFTITQEDGLNYTVKDIPHKEWKTFFATVQPISENNFNIKANYQNQIHEAKSLEDLNKIQFTFPKIQTVNINL